MSTQKGEKINPNNFHPMFTKEQLSTSLRATQLLEPVLRATVIMDQEKLNSDILSALPDDPVYIAHQKDPQPRWSITPDGFLHQDDLIYILDSNNLRLRVLRHKHNHILSRHPGQNKTVKLIRQDYTWPGLREFVKKYVKSCTTCMRAKPQRHKPYVFLKQLPIPKCPWNSISMDFIETLPTSSGYDSILVIVDCLTKQGIFIPTTVADKQTRQFRYLMIRNFLE
jgi:Integrase zinc binding domain